MDKARSFLVLWQTAEAESWIGEAPSGSVGAHMKGLVKGDTIFVCACDNLELFLLGAIKVSKLGIEGSGPYRGKPRADGKPAGPFQMLPLGTLKWQLRFEQTSSPRLSGSKSLLWQVRSRRRLTPASGALLMRTLEKQAQLQPKIDRQFAREGRLLMRVVTARERDPKVRAAALRAYDFTCAICEVKPAEVYGRFAKECLEVHHLRPLALDIPTRSSTTLADVIVLCPTCHRALHMSENPGAWQRFKRQCSL